MSPAFKTIVLRNYEATYYYCNECGFLSAQNPYWLEEAYSSAITLTDIGLVSRNVTNANKLSVVLYFLLGERGAGRYVDFAGGYGILTRLMRDYGFDFYWSDKYCQNLMAYGFDYTQKSGDCRAVTAFEVLEHTEDPVRFVEDALKFAQSDTLIFTTELYEGNYPPPDKWWYYSFETGQHIAFFQRRTLKKLANKLGLHFCSNGWLHIISRDIISETLFKMYTGRLSFFALRWIRKHLASRMPMDWNILVDQLKLLKH